MYFFTSNPSSGENTDTVFAKIIFSSLYICVAININNIIIAIPKLLAAANYS